MKVALISYEPDNYDRDELDDLKVGDFDPEEETFEEFIKFILTRIKEII